jgi:RNA 2',3'-cyclic 3'-phosphodiesterase
MSRRPRAPARRRLFFALWPDEEVRGRLGRVARWCQHRSGGREVADANLHLTLLFLGELTDQQALLAQRVGDGAVLDRCALLLERIEYWPGPGVLAAIPAAPVPALDTLVRTLRADLGPHLPLPREPFAPHVTLVRRVEALAPVPIEPLKWEVERYALVESRRNGAGTPDYVPLGDWPAR